jgi:hypothetical protein
LSQKQVLDEVLCIIADLLPYWGGEVVVPMQHIVQDLIVVLAAKRRPPTQHYEHHHAHGPVVALGSVTALEDLRRYVVWRTVRRGHEFVLGDLLREAEVDQLYMRVIVLLI